MLGVEYVISGFGDIHWVLFGDFGAETERKSPTCVIVEAFEESGMCDSMVLLSLAVPTKTAYQTDREGVCDSYLIGQMID